MIQFLWKLCDFDTEMLVSWHFPASSNFFWMWRYFRLWRRIFQIAEVAGIDRYFCATLNTSGNESLWCFHHSSESKLCPIWGSATYFSNGAFQSLEEMELDWKRKSRAVSEDSSSIVSWLEGFSVTAFFTKVITFFLIDSSSCERDLYLGSKKQDICWDKFVKFVDLLNLLSREKMALDLNDCIIVLYNCHPLSFQSCVWFSVHVLSVSQEIL